MSGMHISKQAIDLAEGVAEGGIATVIAVLGLITAATLIYAWFIA